MKDIHQQIFQEYSHDFIGLPYLTYDCYDIVKLFYIRVFQISLTEYGYDDPLNKECMTSLISSQKGKFKEVTVPKFGDIILLKVKGLPCHLGIYLWDGRFLHTTTKTGCIVDMISNWKTRIEGYYNHG